MGYVLVMSHGVAHRVTHFQSSFRQNVPKVTICAQILKWQRFLTVIYRFKAVIYWFLAVIHRFLTVFHWLLMVIHWFLTVILTRGRYRAARAVKKLKGSLRYRG